MKKVTILLAILTAWAAHAGRLVVHNDEWPLTDTGFSTAGAGPTSTFALNLANYFTGGGSGNFLIYSNNFGLAGSTLASTMTGAGHTWTVSTAVSFTAASLAAYDAVFLALPTGGFDATEAAAYINAGGNIYIAAGTGIGGAAVEAAFWNPLINAFGLTLAPAYNGIAGNIPISSSHPVLAGVSQFYQNNGNSVSLFGSVPGASIILTSQASGEGLIGVYDSTIPEPQTCVLLASGLGILLLRRKLG